MSEHVRKPLVVGMSPDRQFVYFLADESGKPIGPLPGYSPDVPDGSGKISSKVAAEAIGEYGLQMPEVHRLGQLTKGGGYSWNEKIKVFYLVMEKPPRHYKTPEGMKVIKLPVAEIPPSVFPALKMMIEQEAEKYALKKAITADGWNVISSSLAVYNGPNSIFDLFTEQQKAGIKATGVGSMPGKRRHEGTAQAMKDLVTTPTVVDGGKGDGAQHFAPTAFPGAFGSMPDAGDDE